MEISPIGIDELDKSKEELLLLIRETIIHNFEFNKESTICIEDIYNNLRQYVLEDKAIVFVAKEKESVIGWAWCHPIQRMSGCYLHIAYFAVLNDMQNKGVGKAIFCEVERYAKTKDYMGIDLMVTASNVEAVAFYEKQGMVADRLLMKKDY